MNKKQHNNCNPYNCFYCNKNNFNQNKTTNNCNKLTNNFPVDPIRDFAQRLLDTQYLFSDVQKKEEKNNRKYSLISNEIYDNDIEEDSSLNASGSGINSNDSSTNSLIKWNRQFQQTSPHNYFNKNNQKSSFSSLSNGSIFRIEQKTRYSTSTTNSTSLFPLKCSSHRKLKLNKNSFSTKSFKARKRKKQQKSLSKNNCKNYFPFIIISLLLLSIILLAYSVILIAKQQIEINLQQSDTLPPYKRLLRENLEKHNETRSKLMEMFNGTRIIESLKWISSKMHVAGTEEQLNLMDTLAEKYKLFGFNVQKFEYPSVLLSTPDYSSPNTIHVWNDQNFRWELISSGVGRLPLNTVMEDELREQLENDPRINLWWNAYSHNGTAISDLVYANYGTKEDFELLNKSNISISGKIVLIRYGVIFRGDKIFNAEKRGAIGVILYSDPIDYVLGNETFPNDVWLPPSGSQRGALYRGMGDPETPLLPSLDYVHREFNEKQLRSKGMLPNIPVTSIGYHDAQRIFERMNGEPAIWSRWSGALQVTYRLTGTNLFRMDVKTQNVHRPIKNFIAKIEGAEEPDRWVLLGNHADAWSKGSIDPGTGTSIMLEIARVLSVYSKETGWRPRRTIIFCQWDAEEFGLIGSIEWVEQYLHQLKQRAVAYINLDNFNGNTTLNIKSVPLLYRLIVDVASRIKQPSESEINNGRYTLYDSWRFHNTRSTLNGDRSLPFIQLPHSGSDFQAFISFAGIPVADIRMENVPYSFMLYHTAFEVPWLNENFLDPKGLTSIALGQFWLEIVRQLADNILIPFNIEDYCLSLFEYLARANAQMKLEGVIEHINNTKFELL
ncbi:hypothetical protein ACQ4LE_011211, partial [Meloidogyne hapla]